MMSMNATQLWPFIMTNSCVSVGKRASSVDDINSNSMTYCKCLKKNEIDKVYFRLNPLTEQNSEFF